MQNILFIISGLVLLVAGGNWLLKSAVALSLRLNIPKIVIGMTVVSLATSAPELIVSINSALEGYPDSIDVNKSFYFTDWPVMMLASLLFFGFIYFDGELQQYEGIIMVVLLFVFLVYLLRFQKTAVVDELPEDDVELPLYKTVLFLGLGGVALWGGSELLINGAVGMAKNYGISERIIAVTVVSVGTSIPELAASIIAVFNLLAVLGITAIITPIKVADQGLLSNDIFWMLGISFLILPLVFIPKGLRLGWRDGIILVGIYITFVFFTIR